MLSTLFRLSELVEVYFQPLIIFTQKTKNKAHLIVSRCDADHMREQN